MKGKPMTARELLARLENDPEYQARRAELDRKRAEIGRRCAEDERELVAEVRQAGYDIESVYDLVNNTPHPFLERRFIGPYPDAYPILVKHLERPHDRTVREGIIRALTEKDAGPAARDALLREFATEKDPSLRWLLANALRVVLTRSERRTHPEVDKVYRTGTSLGGESGDPD